MSPQEEEKSDFLQHVEKFIAALKDLSEAQKKEKSDILEQAKKAPIENFPELKNLVLERPQSVVEEKGTKSQTLEKLSPREVHFSDVPPVANASSPSTTTTWSQATSPLASSTSDDLSSSLPSTATTTQSQTTSSFFNHLFRSEVGSNLKPGASADSETLSSKNPTVKGFNPVGNVNLAELKSNLNKVEERTEEKPQKPRAATLDQSPSLRGISTSGSVSQSGIFFQPKVVPKLSPVDKAKKQAKSSPDLKGGYSK